MTYAVLILLVIVFLFACKTKTSDTGYKSISQEEAVKMMEEEDEYTIVDVRTEEEFREGHIPGAVNIPNEEITDKRPSMLGDTDEILLIYCRSGNRSKQAAKKLADMGYTKVYEFGGINTWRGEIETEVYPYERAEGANLVFEVDGRQMSAYFKGYPDGDWLFQKLKEGSVYFEMDDHGDNGKTGTLPWILPAEDKEIAVRTADLVLSEGNRLIVCYTESAMNGAKVAEFVGMTEGELREFFEEGTVKAELFLDWWDY